MNPSELTSWYRENESTYKALGESATAILTGLCKARKIDYLTISHRVKSLDSIISKVSRKEYTSIKEMTDILGIRVITYVEADIKMVNKVIGDAFRINPQQSINKSEELAYNQVGYRSMHYICDLGEHRLKLPECTPFKDIHFEVQIRTVLQHAWAEIEHDRSYKFSGDLPPDIRRRLSLLAGTLELVDHEFSRLASEIESHEKEERKAAKSQNIATQKISPITVREYLLHRKSVPQLDQTGNERIEAVVNELSRFGVSTVADVDKLLTPEFLDKIAKSDSTTTSVGLLRKAMMYEDVDKYFADAWQKSFTSLSTGTKELLRDRYGTQKTDEILQKYLKNKKTLKIVKSSAADK